MFLFKTKTVKTDVFSVNCLNLDFFKIFFFSVLDIFQMNKIKNYLASKSGTLESGAFLKCF